MHAAVSHSTEITLMALTAVIAAVAIFFAWSRYKVYREEDITTFGKVLENKWYVDELYDSIIVKPINKLGVIADKYFERLGIDALVNGVGRMVNYGSRQMRWLQSGQVGSYVLLMVISMLLFFVLQFFLRK
jgi:NADH-quinone oxidoreductase subunit L